MNKGNSTGTCRTCGCEIIETVNVGVFGDGECFHCEHQRYKSQLDLLCALDSLLEVTIDAGRAAGFEPAEDELIAEQQALDAIAKAYGKPAGGDIQSIAP